MLHIRVTPEVSLKRPQNNKGELSCWSEAHRVSTSSSLPSVGVRVSRAVTVGQKVQHCLRTSIIELVDEKVR
ncbi:N-acetyltransferase eso1 [Fusarium oxysporum f. sp. albedinis]|nr:N-acetyltransferase eso1 [Fusarium oxysporum f. sp. albedinis]